MINNQSLKMVVFSDLHYLDVEYEREHKRKLTHLSLPLLENITNKINNEINPDVCIYLGDFIEDTKDHDHDIKNLMYICNKMKEIKVPLYSVPGNHDLKSMKSREEVENIIGNGHSTFSIDLKGYHLVFLGLESRNELGTAEGGILKTRFISDEDLVWLKNDLQNNNNPCLIFNHYGIADDDMIGNWWFESCPESALLSNRKEVKEILEKDKNIIGVFSGHQHWTKRLTENNVNYFVIGSISENIKSDGIPDGVYFEVDINEKEINVVEKHIKL